VVSGEGRLSMHCETRLWVQNLITVLALARSLYLNVATKHAVDAISRTLLIELVDTPIRVTEINPGMVSTEFSTIRFGGDKSKAAAVYKGLQPLVGQDIGEFRLPCQIPEQLRY